MIDFISVLLLKEINQSISLIILHATLTLILLSSVK